MGAYFTILFTGVAVLHSQEPQKHLAPEAWGEILSHLSSTSRSERDRATRDLTQIAKQFPLIGKKNLLATHQSHPEPEVRERCRMILKSMAADDYERLGEGYLGVSMGQEWQGAITGDDGKRFGMVVTAISEGSPAATAQLQAGDIIVGLGEAVWREPQTILDSESGLSAKIRAIGAGKSVRFGILRGKDLLIREVKLTRRPKLLDQWRPQIQPNGQMKLDHAELLKLINEEKNSADYFKEWLEQAKKDVADP